MNKHFLLFVVLAIVEFGLYWREQKKSRADTDSCPFVEILFALDDGMKVLPFAVYITVGVYLLVLLVELIS